MIIDLNAYRRTIRPIVEYRIHWRPQEDFNYTISDIAQAHDCHLVAVAYYYAEIRGMTPELQAMIDRISQYYHVTGVINSELK